VCPGEVRLRVNFYFLWFAKTHPNHLTNWVVITSLTLPFIKIPEIHNNYSVHCRIAADSHSSHRKALLKHSGALAEITCLILVCTMPPSRMCYDVFTSHLHLTTPRTPTAVENNCHGCVQLSNFFSISALRHSRGSAIRIAHVARYNFCLVTVLTPSIYYHIRTLRLHALGHTTFIYSTHR